jgi:hypothetical protein
VVSLIIRKRVPYPQATTKALAYQVLDFFMAATPGNIKMNENEKNEI